MKLVLTQKKSLAGFLLCLPAIIGLCVFFVIPFELCIYMSFTESTINPVFVGFDNYIDIFNSSAFRLAAGNTFKFVAVAVPAIMIFSVSVALLLYKKLKGHEFFRAVFIFPLVLPTASVVLFFQVVFANGGITDSVLNVIGVPVIDWMNSPFAFVSLVILYVWKNCGYGIILFLAALNSVPQSYYEAAELDGADSRDKFFGITLPLIMPYSFFILIISVVNSFKVFREAYILYGAYPNQSIYMLQHFMNNNFRNLNYIRLSTGAILIFIVIFAVVFILYRLRSKAEGIEL
ncbi:sugar ABC transporter permease [Clostridia bacterium]|nr:sugar ABC transporter permease [Clostridia bacterium]